ncbi:unnamed protein product [Lymnaea stagnalis]|uniref:CUB domain-containing protein n=1 Tax=Lymnaea stagnalis TaxID=6523 RepID=A0AAV2IKC4_LYMST
MAPDFYVNDKVYSTRREMMIQLNTDDMLRPAKIKLEFYAVPPASECGNNAMHDAVILVNSTGSELTSPNYRDFYPLDYQCRYRVKAVNKDDIIVIEVLDSNFITGCRDMLSFFNGPEGWLSRDFFGRVCGQDKKDIFVGMSDRAIIRFESDRSGSYGGWKLKIYSREKGFNSANVAAGQMLLLVILAVIGFLITEC